MAEIKLAGKSVVQGARLRIMNRGFYLWHPTP